VKPILVVGGAGYIGSALVRRLLESGRRVRVLDNLTYGDDPLRAAPPEGLEYMVGDCRNLRNVVAAVRGVDSVVHLAAIVGDPACEQERRAAVEVNYAATRMLIEVAQGHGVQRLVFASSCSVYGAADQWMDENSRVEPVSLYGKTKVDSEDALLGARSSDFHPVVLRLATVFGMSRRPRFDLVVNLLTAKACREGIITIFNPSQWRPFIHVEDVAEGMRLALEAPLASVSGEVFNLGDTRLNYTLGQLAETVLRVFPDARASWVENGDRRDYRVSFEKIRNALAFQCARDLEFGIREIRGALEKGAGIDHTDARFHNHKYLQAAGGTRSSERDSRLMDAFWPPVEMRRSKTVGQIGVQEA
jgi:nucleoside-diphosphate-sugar epimerase